MWKWSDLKRLLGFKKERDIADLGAVMWPAAFPTGIDNQYVPRDPHCTIVIFTDINNPDLGYSLDDVIEVVSEVGYELMLWAKVTGVEWFGEEQNVPVLRVEHGELQTYHDVLVERLTARGIPVDMTFPEYKPHVTIPAEAALDGVYPDNLMLGPVEVWWGEKHYKIGDFM